MTLEIIRSDALSPLRHGFFTRKGGASSGIFHGLNCGTGSSDQAEIVSINRARVAHAMGGAPLTTVHQVHSADVATVDADAQLSATTADAIVTATPGVTLAILTADCQPVLFADAEHGVIGAAHAGWRGALDGILQATVDAMIDAGARRNKIHASIGPCIGPKAYEVGPEFQDRFLEANPDHARFFTQGQEDRLLFDLPAFGLHCLNEAGIASAEWTGHCTYAAPDKFFSFRRSVHQKQADYGRLISAIAL